MTISYKENLLAKNLERARAIFPISQWGSQWNDPIDWNNIPNYITSANGRKFARHPSGMGTVMSFNDGQERNVLVLDAQYRGKGYWGLGNYSRDHYCRDVGLIDGSSKDLPFSGWSDETLNPWITNQDVYTSKENTDYMMSVNSDAQYLAGYCRSKTILHDGIEIGCDAPNLNTVVRLYAEMIKLDSMDSTVPNYSEYSLSIWFSWLSGADYPFCWSSSLYSCFRAMSININSGIYEDIFDLVNFGFAPVLEV